MPSFSTPKASCRTPDNTTATRKPLYDPISRVDVSTMTASPAAGPLTLTCDAEVTLTTIPPTMPAMTPENREAPDPKAIPRQSGRATRNVTTPAGPSYLRKLLHVGETAAASVSFIAEHSTTVVWSGSKHAFEETARTSVLFQGSSSDESQAP